MSGGKKKMEGNPDANLVAIGNYNFIKTLGEGNFAKVKLAKHKITNQEVSIPIRDNSDTMDAN
jgi:MAP/microtubule affinity-regulating kinase